MPINTEVIDTRLMMLAEHLNDLKAFQATSLDAYQKDKILRGYTERTLQVCVQICLDVGYHLIAECGFRTPENSREVFVVLTEEHVIPETLYPNLLNMAGFRNIIVHDYARVANDVVYGILTHDLDDFAAFAKAVIDFVDAAPTTNVVDAAPATNVVDTVSKTNPPPL